MKGEQLKNSGILIFSNLTVNLSNFLKQVIMAYYLGVSGYIDILLLAQIIPAIFQAMIGGGAGEILVTKREGSGYRTGSFEMVFIITCLVPVLLLCTGYYLLIDKFIPFFEINPESGGLLKDLSIIFLINAVPGTFNSILRPQLYSKGLYSFYAVATIVSQATGILFILSFIDSMGVAAFAWGTLIANTINSVWFSFRSGLAFSVIFDLSMWRHEMQQLIKLMKRVFSLSLQTFLNYFGTLWERSYSVKYLTGGYLSSLNYSKTLSELPNTVLLSSILTTSYIEQVKLFKEDVSHFKSYTARTFSLIINLGFLFQVVMLLFAPLIIIFIFRRGNFDNRAVESTLTIFNILTVSFLPRLIVGYLSRTMYILGEYRKLLFANIVKVLVQVGIMVLFITTFRNTIPFAILFSTLSIALILFYLVNRSVRLAGWFLFLVRIIVITAVSLVLYKAHVLILPYYIERTNFEVLLIYMPGIILVSLAGLIYLSKTGKLSELLKKIKKK